MSLLLLLLCLPQPILSLAPEQLQKLVPVLAEVPTEKLAGIFKRLARLPNRTVDNMLALLRSVRALAAGECVEMGGGGGVRLDGILSGVRL
jgi:hypothetical protein